MNVALYATIWIALALFAAGEAVKRARGVSSRPAWRLWAAGAVACAIHVVIAFAIRYGWSHDAAIRETARQTAAVYGLDWGGGVYVNYLFVAVWAIEAWWWRTDPARYAARPRALTWTLRAFYVVIVLNAAVIFARPPARWPGLALTAVLAWTWRDIPRDQRAVAGARSSQR